MLKFRDLNLGYLSYEDGKYIYNSFAENEEKAKKMTFGLLNYDLYNSKNLTSDKLFVEFLPWINAASRIDIKNLCNVLESDNYWQILCKLAKINLNYGDYSISIK